VERRVIGSDCSIKGRGRGEVITVFGILRRMGQALTPREWGIC